MKLQIKLTDSSDKMGAYILINVIALSCVNILFLLLGSFLNAVVILCFWKSNNLRKKLCHFMILVLSCVDLAVVVVIHPLIIFSTVAWYVENEALQDKLDNSEYVTSILYALSFYALLTMNIERYVAVKYPIYHWTSMTKTKLMLVFSAFFLLALILKILSATDLAPQQVPSSLTFLVLLTIMLLTNCKMYIVAKRRRKEKKRRDTGNKMQNEKENSKNSEKAHEKSDKLQEENNNLAEKSNNLSEKSSNLSEKSSNLSEKSNNLSEKSDNLRKKSTNLSEKSDTLPEESDNLSEKSSNLSEKSSNLSEKSTIFSEKSDKLHENSTNLSEKSDKLRKKGDSSQDNQRKRHNKRAKISLQNISICILAVACFTLCAIPGMIFNGLNVLKGRGWFGKDNFKLILLWVRTLITMNSSFNSLLFFWKNAILRKEGKQVFTKIRKD